MIRPILSLSISCLLIATLAWCASPEDKTKQTEVPPQQSKVDAPNESPEISVPNQIGATAGASTFAAVDEPVPVPNPVTRAAEVSPAATPIVPRDPAPPKPTPGKPAPPTFDLALPAANTQPGWDPGPPLASGLTAPPTTAPITHPPKAIAPPGDVTATTADKETAISEIMRLRQRFGSPIKGTSLDDDTGETAAEFGQALEAVANTSEPAANTQAGPHHCPLCPHPTAQPQVGVYTAPVGWTVAPGPVATAPAHNCPLCPAPLCPTPTTKPQVDAYSAPTNWTAAPGEVPSNLTSTCMSHTSPVKIIREAARQLDQSAAALEDVQDYKRADALRESAQRLRLQARQMVHLQTQAQTPPPTRY